MSIAWFFPLFSYLPRVVVRLNVLLLTVIPYSVCQAGDDFMFEIEMDGGTQKPPTPDIQSSLPKDDQDQEDADNQSSLPKDDQDQKDADNQSSLPKDDQDQEDADNQNSLDGLCSSSGSVPQNIPFQNARVPPLNKTWSGVPTGALSPYVVSSYSDSTLGATFTEQSLDSLTSFQQFHEKIKKTGVSTHDIKGQQHAAKREGRIKSPVYS